MKGLKYILVGGGQAYYGPTASRDKQVLIETAKQLDTKYTVLTGGMLGVGNDFASSFKGSSLDIISGEYENEYLERQTGRTYNVVGQTQKERRLGLLETPNIKVALFFQGGKYTTHEIKLVLEKNIPVITLYGGGGASGGTQPYDGWTYTPPDDIPELLKDTNPDTDPKLIASVIINEINKLE